MKDTEAPISYTAGERGRLAKVDLQKSGQNTNLNESNGGGDPIMTADEAKQAENIKKEDELVLFVTSILEQALEGSGRVIVNSEVHPWLWPVDYLSVSKNTMLKPDLFTCPPAMYSKKDAGAHVEKGRNHRFGVIKFRELRPFVVVMEAKLLINDSSLSELLTYLERMSHQSDSGQIARGVLFDVFGFELVVTNRGIPVSRTFGKWGVAGGKKVLSEFLAPYENLECGLCRACLGMNVALDEPDSYLGKGATGFAFRGSMSVGGERKEIAIKIALNNGVFMWSQVNRMQSAAVMRATNVMRILGKIWVDGASIPIQARVSGYVMKSVGKRVKGREEEIFSSLRLLHSFGVVHGDARRPNVVDVDGDFEWIDLVPIID
jgi:hypothetical protein